MVVFISCMSTINWFMSCYQINPKYYNSILNFDFRSIENNHFEILNIRFVRTWLLKKRIETQTQHFSFDDTDVLEKSRGDII